MKKLKLVNLSTLPLSMRQAMNQPEVAPAPPSTSTPASTTHKVRTLDEFMKNYTDTNIAMLKPLPYELMNVTLETNTHVVLESLLTGEVYVVPSLIGAIEPTKRDISVFEYLYAGKENIKPRHFNKVNIIEYNMAVRALHGDFKFDSTKLYECTSQNVRGYIVGYHADDGASGFMDLVADDSDDMSGIIRLVELTNMKEVVTERFVVKALKSGVWVIEDTTNATESLTHQYESKAEKMCDRLNKGLTCYTVVYSGDDDAYGLHKYTIDDDGVVSCSLMSGGYCYATYKAATERVNYLEK